ncbi:transmembrane protein 53-A-like isoform X2 [Sceloporus undulatus]|uniref:transmembrane protein 53-A-like isoform X2 n=1 Tax=Sceloporus undulatus TaxID=8520 RepID=UPI001C4C40C6|nr:transmembrane protein 53-A-like isoform X2 [Sceloporus undulatus]
MLVKGLLSQPGFLGALRRLRPKRGLLIPGQTWAGAPSRMSLAESNAGLPEVQPCCHKATAALKEEEKSPPGPDPLPAFPSPGASVMRVSRTVHLYRPPGVPSGSSPLVLLLPWFGAPAHALAKYLSLYVSRGWMVLVAESSVGHFLWPRWGLDYAAQVLGLLREGGPLGGHPLLIHAFSIGGYTFAQMMVHLAEHPEEYASVRERIRGLIYDSLVAGSLADMARGVARMTSSAVLRPFIHQGTLLYFRLFRRCTVAYYEAALDIFHQPPLRCPVLVFFCHNDPLSDARVMQQLLDAWRVGGIAVQVQEWPVSHHAAHLRLHPQDYTQALDTFLQGLPLPPPRLQAKL